MTISAVFDASRPLRLPPDVRVLDLDVTTVQVGTEAGRRIRIRDAPAGTATVLERFCRATAPAAAVADRPDAPDWLDLLARLVRAGLLVPAAAVEGDRTDAHRPDGDLLALSHRYGHRAAQLASLARSDALVVIDGGGTAATLIAAALADSGIGHIYSHGTPGIRPAVPLGPPHRTTRTHRPAPQDKAALVVLVHPAQADPVRVAELTVGVIPQLAVRLGHAECVVGPLALPGRSACLTCLRKHHEDLDAHWATVANALTAEPPPVPARLALRAAAIAVDEVLTFLDGSEPPASLGATLRVGIGSRTVERVAWPRHPRCGCRLLAAPPD